MEVRGREKVVEGAGGGESQRKRVRGWTSYSPTNPMSTRTTIGRLERTEISERTFLAS